MSLEITFVVNIQTLPVLIINNDIYFIKNIARGTTDPGYRVYNLSYLSS